MALHTVIMLEHLLSTHTHASIEHAQRGSAHWRKCKHRLSWELLSLDRHARSARDQ